MNRAESSDSLDDFPTPLWATRALTHHVIPSATGVVWEPAANRGYMVRALSEHFDTVIGSDFNDYGAGFPVIDFLDGPTPADYGQKVDWIITNPPFNKAEEFSLRALELADIGVAMFARNVWLESKGRYARLFKPHPPTLFAPFVERVKIVKGGLDQNGSTNQPYAWFVWDKEQTHQMTRVVWIPPCRNELEQEGDWV